MANEVRIGSKSLIKDINRIHIIRIVREKGPISRAEIAKETGLVGSTVGKLSDELIANNIVYEAGEGASSGGRKPVNILFNNNYGYIISIKIGQENLRIALVNLCPTVIEDKTISFPKGASYDDVMALVYEEVGALLQSSESDNKKVLGIGVAVSGLVNSHKGVLLASSFLGWSQDKIREDLASRFSLDVYVDNDVNCYALAQHWLGAGIGKSHLICVTLGEGIGSGIIMNNQLYKGSIGGAGELGHLIVEQGGRPCYCGQKGCLEAYASAKAIQSRAEEILGERLSYEAISERYHRGDETIQALFKDASLHIIQALVNLIMINNPEMIIIAGDPPFSEPSFFSELENGIKENWFSWAGYYQIEVVKDRLDEHLFQLGAAILVVDHLFGMPLYEANNPLLA